MAIRMKDLALIFPGQGSQGVGMGKSWYDTFRVSREIAHEADSVLGYALTDLMFNGPLEVLSQTEHTQPAILTASIMGLKACEEELHFYDDWVCVAGHSVGEYAALVAAGCIPFSQALELVSYRAQVMQEACPYETDGTPCGAMCAILGLEKDEMQAILNSMSEAPQCTIANDNCPGQIVITGFRRDVEKVRDRALEQGAKRGVLLSVSGPFHSPLMQPAADKLKDRLEKILFKDARIPLLPNISATPTTSGETLKQGLYQQVAETVRWRESAALFPKMGVQRIFEIGNGHVLTNITQRCLPESIIKSIQTAEDIKGIEA